MKRVQAEPVVLELTRRLMVRRSAIQQALTALDGAMKATSLEEVRTRIRLAETILRNAD